MPKTVKGKSESGDFLRSNIAYTSNDCLIWPFGKARGYGTLKYDGKIRKAHRVMCELVKGPPPSPSHEAAHSCGNHACVNPMHLRWKTRAENQAESVAMGRYYSGGKRGKLGRERALQIRALKGQLSQNKIAERFGVTHSTVAKIHRGELWQRA